jgi:hypothetical protein
MRAGRLFLSVLGLALGAGGCSSEAIDRGGASGAGGSAGLGAGGSTSGSGGKPPATLPDYTKSPCYGHTATTEVYDLDTHQVHPVTATCRAEGTRTRFYVSDELWQTQADASSPVLDQPEVDAFMYRYELEGQATSVRPDLGALPTDEFVFGALNPALLTDDKLPIYVVNSSGAGDGYLCSWCDELALHLDGSTLRSLHADRTLSIAAHESFHAIHRGYDADEEVWIDESLAEAAMTVNGYFTDQAWLSSFVHDTNQAWGPGLTDAHDFNYGAGLLFGTYLWERGGAELLAAVTHEPKNGWAGLDAALASAGDPDDGYQVFLDMALALFLDDPRTGYEFKSFDLAGTVLPYALQTGKSYADTLAPYGLLFATFEADARRVTLSTKDAVTALLVLDGSPVSVQTLTPGRATTFTGTPRFVLLTAKAAADVSLLAE